MSSPDEMQWNPGGFIRTRQIPDFAALHPGYFIGYQLYYTHD